LPDKLSVEPPVEGNVLTTAPNCLVTPHMAWGTQASRQRLLDITVENVRGFLMGEVQNEVIM